ncbi:MAG: replication-associated recombination protein A [Pseudomonadales bacterium]|jgi:putative ATPase|nr:replication-associated recombination protein A [Pseudomonadales bacterium]
MSQPLAAILRPQNLDEFIGQKHLVGENKPLRKAIENEQVYSMIFWGPPGVGKTTLARLIAKLSKKDFHEISAVAAGKADLRKIIDDHRKKNEGLEGLIYGAPIVFIDEIHRFNKAQQDFLLPYVETGEIILIGATTENPSFEVINALLSRSRTYVFKSLTEEDLNEVLDRALKYLKPQLGKKKKLSKTEREWLINFANGDARQMLGLIDNTIQTFGDLSLKLLKENLQSTLRYDRDGEEHYDTISAFIKSMRAGETDAALYYLARMLHNGEKPEFVARRMVVFASEDIGLAAPTALVVANATFDAVHKIGMPEAAINLAHGVAYLSQCKKSRKSYDAYFAALADVEKNGNLTIPLHIRNAPTKLMKELDYGKGYEMYNESKASYLPTKLSKKKYLKS